MITRVLHTVLAVYMLLITVGISVSKHYCFDRLKSVSFFSEAKACCGNTDCCHTEDNMYVLDADYILLSSDTDTDSYSLEFDLPVLTALYQVWDKQEINKDTFIAYSPPPISNNIVINNQCLLL